MNMELVEIPGYLERRREADAPPDMMVLGEGDVPLAGYPVIPIADVE